MTRILTKTALLGAAAMALVAADASPAAAQPAEKSAMSQTDRLGGLGDFIDGVMAQQIASHEVAGATVAVVHDGGLLFSEGYGFADVAAGTPVDPDLTLFRPGSVSKLFTWTALMQQVEQGNVDLDEDVNAYIDFEIPPYEGEPIRVIDLFTHAPGWSDVSGITAASVEELTPYGEWIKDHIPPSIWAPGGEISYSNYGVALTGYIVEQVSGESFADYTEAHIFAPLGMTSTTFREPLPEAFRPRMAAGYELEEGRLVAQPFELFSNIMPAGSASSTAHDMARFMLAMLNGGEYAGTRILEPSSVELLFADSIRNAPDLPGMAHGFYVVREAGPRLVGHGGNTGDFHSNLILAPEEGFGFFVSTTGGDESSAGRTDLTNAIIGRVFPETPAPRAGRPADERSPAGTYRVNRRNYANPPNEAYDITVAEAEAHGAILITNQDETTYWERIAPLTYEKVTGARPGGPFERVQFHSGETGLVLSFNTQPYMAYRQLAAEE